MTLPHHRHPGVATAAVGDVVGLDGEEGHHAVVVRRTRVGEHLVLTDGRGATALVEVTTVTRRDLLARVVAVGLAEQPQPALTVVQALPKGDRGELAVELCTEVGVAVVVPWAAARCVTTWRGERVAKARARWESTALAAAKQARRPWHPVVAPLADTSDVVGLVAGADLAVVLHEDAAGSLAPVAVPASGRVVVVVGPEGGLTDPEVAALTGAGAVAVRLGTEVLRTSTAGLAACAALLARTARWS